MPHFIFIQQNIRTEYFKMLYNLHFFSSKCRLFHNATLFGFCITHILNTGVLKFKKKKSVAKRLNRTKYVSVGLNVCCPLQSLSLSARRTQCYYLLTMTKGVRPSFELHYFQAYHIVRWRHVRNTGTYISLVLWLKPHICGVFSASYFLCYK